jgi:acetyl esterase/lipase
VSDDILTLAPPPYDSRLAYGPDPNQFVDLRLPKAKGPFPLVINIHGGFWRAKYNLDHAGHLCAALASKGIAAANLEYRRVGNEGGGWPGTFADIRAAYSYLVQNSRQHNLNASKIVVMGHSAGGQLALCLAAHERTVTRVVSLAGVLNLERAYDLHLSHDAVVEFLHGKPAEVPDHYREADPTQLSIPQARQWIVQGSSDDVVPPAFASDYVAAKQGRNGKEEEDVRLLEIPGAGHFDVINPDTQAWDKVESTILQMIA